MTTYNREYYLKNRDKMIQSAIKRQKKNKDRANENCRKYRARRTDRLRGLEAENKQLKDYWFIEINNSNRYRERCDELEKENKELKAKNRALESRLEKALVYNI